jgi:hypothetical protein
VFAGLAGITAGACKPQSGGDGQDAKLTVKTSCSDYCKHAKECDDKLDLSKCNSTCLDAIGNCQAAEQDLAIDRLDKCSDVSCNDFVGCSIEVSAKCFLGI